MNKYDWSILNIFEHSDLRQEGCQLCAQPLAFRRGLEGEKLRPDVLAAAQLESIKPTHVLFTRLHDKLCTQRQSLYSDKLWMQRR